MPSLKLTASAVVAKYANPLSNTYTCIVCVLQNDQRGTAFRHHFEEWLDCICRHVITNLAWNVSYKKKIIQKSYNLFLSLASLFFLNRSEKDLSHSLAFVNTRPHSRESITFCRNRLSPNLSPFIHISSARRFGGKIIGKRCSRCMMERLGRLCPFVQGKINGCPDGV